MLFSGETNSIRIRREYYQDYACQFALENFPFDTQMCAMVFQVQGKTVNYVRLEQDGEGIEFMGDKTLVEYDIQLQRFVTQTRNNVSEAIVKIVFRRRMEYHVFSTFIQTGILIVTGYITFYFDIDDFGNRIMVNLTATLVIATIVSSIREVILVKINFFKLK